MIRVITTPTLLVVNDESVAAGVPLPVGEYAGGTELELPEAAAGWAVENRVARLASEE